MVQTPIHFLFIENKYYNNPKIEWTNSKNGHYDVVLINSVIQYIAPNFLFNLINSLNKKLKKKGVIFLGDVPRIYRFLEFINCTNLIKIYYLVRYFLFKKEYFKKEYYLHDKSFFMKKFAKSKLIFLPSNSYFFKKRYCLIVKKYNENN